MPDKYRYVGGGAFVPGVPTRDLSEKEWALLPKSLQKKALAAGTHKAPSKSRSKPEEVNDNG